MSHVNIDFKRVFDAAPSPMLVVTPDFGIVAVNRAYTVATGTTAADLVGRAIFDAFPDNPADVHATGVANLRRSFETVLATRLPDTMALQKYDIRPGGAEFEERWWSPVNHPVFDGDGNIRLIIHRVEDVTELVRARAAAVDAPEDVSLQERIVRAEADLFTRGRELQEANRRLSDALRELEKRTLALQEEQAAKDRFIATLCHELRNPLAAIQAALEVLALDSAPTVPVKVIDRQVRSLVRMTDDLLDVSRALSGKMRLVRSAFDLREVVDDVVADRTDLAGRQLVVNVPDRPVIVEGDGVRLTQLLGNLLDNAFKFTESRGEIRIELTTTSAAAQLAVIDDGIGFSADAATQLFETFVQADTSLSRSAGGLGLGLAIVRSIAEFHGGTIEAHSAGVGTGATFAVVLPLADAHQATSPGEAPGEAPTRPRPPMRILLIDDNTDLTESFSAILSHAGHAVDTAFDGAHGIAAANASSYHVIVCDIGLPDLDGYSVAEAVRKQPLNMDTPLIAITGYGTETRAATPNPDPFEAHVRKPASPRHLLDLLDCVVRGKG